MINFLFPSGFWGLLVVPLIIIWQLVRLKPPPYTVSSLIIWNKILNYQATRTNIRWGLFILSVLFQVLAVTSLVLALAEPVLVSREIILPETIILLDNTVGMKTTQPIDTSRWSDANRMLISILDNLLPQTPVTLIPLVGNITNRKPPREIKEHLQAILPTDLPPDWTDLALKIPSQEGRDNTVIYILSDRVPPPDFLTTLKAKPLLILTGTSSNNIGIIHMAAQIRPDGGLDVLVSVKNFSQSTRNVPIVLYLNEQVLARTVLNLASRETKTYIFKAATESHERERQPLPPHLWLKCKLEIADDLNVDNEAYLTPVMERTVRVCFIGEENPALIKALKANRRVVLEYSREETPVKPTDYDIFIYYRVVHSHLPAGKTVIINPPTDFSPFLFGPRFVPQTPISIDTTSPLMQQVNPSDFHIWGGKPIQSVSSEAGYLHRLLGTAEQILIGEWSRPGGNQTHLIVIGFGLSYEDTDWMQSLSFPIFWANLVNYFYPLDTLETLLPQQYSYYHTGEIISVNLPPSPTDKEVVITTPRGQKITQASPNAVFIPQETGLYEARSGSEKRLFAVNLCNESASDNAGITLLPPSDAGANQRPKLPTTNYEQRITNYAPIFIALGLVLLLFAWWVNRV